MKRRMSSQLWACATLLATIWVGVGWRSHSSRVWARWRLCKASRPSAVASNGSTNPDALPIATTFFTHAVGHLAGHETDNARRPDFRVGRTEFSSASSSETKSLE